MNTNRTQPPGNTNDGVSKVSKIAYRDGYLHGRDLEHPVQAEKRIIRDNNTAANGLLLGITIASLAGLLGGALFLLINQNQPLTTPVRTTPVPTISQPQSTQKETTIIERTVDRTQEVIPVPQQQAPAQSAPEAQASPTQPKTTADENAGNEAPEPAAQP